MNCPTPPPRNPDPATLPKRSRPKKNPPSSPRGGFHESLQHQGSRSDKKKALNYKPTFGLNPFNIREAGQTIALVKGASGWGLNPFNIREAGQTELPPGASVAWRLNPFNIREAGQTVPQRMIQEKVLSQSLQHQGSRSDPGGRVWSATPSGLNPFNIREAGQTPRSKFVNADKHLQGCLKTKRRNEKLTLGMGLVHGSV